MTKPLFAEMEEELERISKWPWNEDSGFVYSSSGEVVCQTWAKDEHDFENHKSNRLFIAQAPSRIQALMDHWVEERAKCLLKEFLLEDQWCHIKVGDPRYEWELDKQWRQQARKELREEKQ